jgi:hypothetical protein
MHGPQQRDNLTRYRQLSGIALLAVWLSVDAAPPAKPTPHPQTPPPCCVVPPPPATADARGTPQQPLAVEVTNFPPPAAPPPVPVEPPKDRSGWFIAVATGALAIFTWLLWRAPGALVDENVATAKRELRAYVFVHDAVIESAHAGRMPRAQIPIKNYGKTPAYEIKVSINMGYDAALRGDAPEREANSLGHLGPGADLTADVEFGQSLSVPQYNAMMGGGAYLFVYGRIRYVDAFGMERYTRFGLRIGNTARAAQTGLASTGGEWNTTDDNISALAQPEVRSWLSRFALAVSRLPGRAR